MGNTIGTGIIAGAQVAANRAKKSIPTTTLAENRLFNQTGIGVNKLSASEIGLLLFSGIEVKKIDKDTLLVSGKDNVGNPVNFEIKRGEKVIITIEELPYGSSDADMAKASVKLTALDKYSESRARQFIYVGPTNSN